MWCLFRWAKLLLVLTLVSPFFFPVTLTSVLDEGWTCADLHLSRAGLDQQDHNTRWGSTSFIGHLGSTDKAFLGASKSWRVGFSSIWTSKRRTTAWADRPGLSSPHNRAPVEVPRVGDAAFP